MRMVARGRPAVGILLRVSSGHKHGPHRCLPRQNRDSPHQRRGRAPVLPPYPGLAVAPQPPRLWPLGTGLSAQGGLCLTVTARPPPAPGHIHHGQERSHHVCGGRHPETGAAELQGEDLDPGDAPAGERPVTAAAGHRVSGGAQRRGGQGARWVEAAAATGCSPHVRPGLSAGPAMPHRSAPWKRMGRGWAERAAWN